MDKREELEAIARRWLDESRDDWGDQNVRNDVNLWKGYCEALGVDYDSDEFRAAMLIVFVFLSELLREEKEQPIALPGTQPTIRAVITTLLIGVFGDEEEDTDGTG